MTTLLRRTMAGIYVLLGPEKFTTYSSEYASGFSGSAAAHLPTSLSPRDEWQCQTGSWPA